MFETIDEKIARLTEEIEDLRRRKSFKPTPEKPKNRDVHTEHCCEIHKNCKYGDKNCTVATGNKHATYECNCDWM